MIRGAFRQSAGAFYPFISMGIRVPGLGEAFAPLPFVIDTGAPRTVLHPTDIALSWQLPDAEQVRVFESQPRTGSAGGIGGLAHYASVPATLVLLHDDGRVDLLEQDVLITTPSAANRTLPSLLGMDVLQHYKLTITGRKDITLESLAELGIAPTG